MQSRGKKGLSTQPPLLPSAELPSSVIMGGNEINGGLTGTPALPHGRECAAVPLRSAGRVAVSPLHFVSECAPLAVPGGGGEMRSSFRTSTLPPHFLVHPKGFRVLKTSSILERNMRSYFRLPQPLSVAESEARRRARRTILCIEADEAKQKAKVSGNQDGVVLDGFLMLSASGADDPEKVTQLTLHSSHLSSSVAEDLEYFTNVTLLDLSDNNLRVAHVLPFPRLEVVHLVCNNIVSLSELSQSSSSSLSTIVALDLAYNRIPAIHINYLNACSALRQLDMSNNGLRTLPADLSGLVHLTHFALESNELSSVDVFYALSTMPSLIEVNLASNQLSAVPPLDASSCDTDRDPKFVLFPCLQVMCLSANRFRHIEDLRPLAALHRTLRRVAVGDNPFLHLHAYQLAELQQALDEAVVEAYYIAFVSPQENTDSGELPEMVDTWHLQTWVRYIPRPEGEREMSASEMVGAAALGAHSSSHVNDSAQQSAATKTRGGIEERSPQGEAPLHREDVLPPLQTVMDYLNRYRVHVNASASTPPLIPRQPKGYFYSLAFRQSEQGMRDSMPLVTLPPYNEFMDVYRIVGQRRTQPPSDVGRVSASRPASAQRAMAKSGSSPQSVIIPQLPPLSNSPPIECEGSVHQATEQATLGADEEKTGGGTGFFLTDLDSGAVGHAGGSSQRHSSEDGKVPVAPKLGGVQVDVANKQPPPPPPADSSDQALPHSRLPRSVLCPGTINVHAAISELRGMLRKPLPSLPYKASRSMQTTG